MVREEFERMADRPEFPMPDPIPFPEDGVSDEHVLEAVRERLSLNPYEVENDCSSSSGFILSFALDLEIFSFPESTWPEITMSFHGFLP